MEKFVILPDSTADISEEARNDVGLNAYVPGHASFNDGRDISTTLDWSVVSREEYYKALGNKKVKVTTSPPSPAEYYETFEKYVKDGYGVIVICLSSAISGSHRFATSAAEDIKKNYPDAKIYCFDSFRMTAGEGLLAYYAAELQGQGKSFDEVVEWLEANKRKVHQMGPIDDLMFIARRGRISKGKAIFGNLAGVKPMGDCNTEGYTTVITKAKGINKALDITVKYVEKTAVDIENQTIFVAHSDRELYANSLKEKLSALNPKKIYITDIFPACGANIGPGMVGVYYLGDEVSEDLTKEKEIMSQITGK